MSSSPVSEEVAGAFTRYFVGGDGPTHDVLAGILHETGYATDDPYTGAPGVSTESDVSERRSGRLA